MLLCAGLVCGGFVLSAAERSLDFSQFPLNEIPRGFRSTVAGEGQPGEWRIIQDEVPPTFAPITPQAEALPRRPVLAQLSRDPTDEHFPILVFEEETFGDFTVTTRFKIVEGVKEQMAGMAFRFQDEKNYYYIRASALGNNIRFFKVVQGERSAPIGPDARIPLGVWLTLTIECTGNRIRCLVNGQEVLPALTDNSFSYGKIAFWTKSDSVAHFTDARIVYTPRERLAETLVRETMTRYPRLAGLKIFARTQTNGAPVILASTVPEEVGQPGDSTIENVIGTGAIYRARQRKTVMVTMPLHDRNGDTVAAVRVIMDSFPGQTEDNALARALPVVKAIDDRVRTVKDLRE